MEVTIRHRYNLNVELKLKASKRFIFFHVHVFQTNSASYEYKNTFRSADNGTQLVSMEIPNIKKDRSCQSETRASF